MVDDKPSQLAAVVEMLEMVVDVLLSCVGFGLGMSSLCSMLKLSIATDSGSCACVFFGRGLSTDPARCRKPEGMHLLAAERATDDWRRREDVEYDGGHDEAFEAGK